MNISNTKLSYHNSRGFFSNFFLIIFQLLSYWCIHVYLIQKPSYKSTYLIIDSFNPYPIKSQN